MTRKLPEPLKRLLTRIDALSLRERAIVFISLLAVLFLFADRVLFTNLRVQQKQLEQSVSAQLAQLDTMNTQVQRVTIDSSQSPDSAYRTRLADLKKQYAALEQSSSGVTRALISPSEMTRLAQAVLRRNPGLELLKAENLPAEPLTVKTGAADPSAASAEAGLYKHGLRMEFRGRYLDIVRYLHALEQMSWRVFWDEIKVETEHYPMSRATLTIYTLSLDKAWIGM